MSLDDFYPIQSIDYHRRQMLFLIENLGLLRDGTYPPEPDIYLTEVMVREGKKRVYIEIEQKESSYIDPRIKKKVINRHAPFEDSAMIAAEVDLRLDRTGIDGKLLVAEVKAGYILSGDEAKMSGYTLFSPEARMALNYVSGKGRKRTPYTDWKKQRRYRKSDYFQVVKRDLTARFRV